MDLSKLQIDREPTAPRRRSRPLGRWVLLALVALGIFWFRAPLQRFFVEARLPKVQVVEAYKPDARTQSMASGLSAGGYVIARKRAALSSDVPGRIVEMNVREGSAVEEGQVVARLAHSEQEARLAVAQANVASARAAVDSARARQASAELFLASLASEIERAQADLENARAQSTWSQSELERYRRLREQNLGTASIMDERVRSQQSALAGIESAEAGVRSAQAALERGRADVDSARFAVTEAEAFVAQCEAQREEADAALEKTFVRAPFAGVVVLKDAEVGEVVSPNSQGGNSRGAVATLVDFRSLEAQVELPEVRIAGVTVGAPAVLYLDAFPDVALAGRVDRIWPTANRQKATVEVRVTFDELDARVRPEMGLRVVFSTGEKQPATE
ncbi:MAG: HlyD family secretion protein, partial [Planctomycetes bacterium]|nr:HlyD family secretion protein [Planctomycetota bacterium]